MGSQSNDGDRGETTRKLYVFLIAFVAAFGGFLFGYDIYIIAGAQLFLKSQFSLSEAMFGFTTASATLGCIVGPFLSGWTCDRFSRKNTLIVAAILFGLSAIGTALPKDITTFNIFRIVGGIGMGLASVASPMYITEVAPARYRGRLGVMYQLAIAFGCTTSVVVAYFLAANVDKYVSWRWMFASELVPIVGFVFLLLLIPHSPRWLAEMGRQEEAVAVLTKINGPQQAELEIQGINQSLVGEKGTFSELFKRGVRRVLVIGVFLAIFNNLTGWTAISFYLPFLFQEAGVQTEADALFQTLIITSVSILLCFACILLVDSIGRKPLWIAACASMALFLSLAAVVYNFHLMGNAVLFVLFLCSVPHEMVLGPLPWLMMSEIHPTRVRARAVAISTTVIWIAAFSGPMLFPLVAKFSRDLIGSIAGVFLLYAVISILALIFGIRWLPETKNKTLEEIAAFLKLPTRSQSH